MDRGAWQATVHGVAKSWTRLSNFTRRASLVRAHLPMQDTQVLFLGREDPLEKEMATHSSILA